MTKDTNRNNLKHETKEWKNIDLIYSSRTQDRILDHRILRSEVLTYITIDCSLMIYNGYIKDHPAYCLDHQCRKFHFFKYIMIERKFQALSWQRKKSFLTDDRKKNPYPSDQVKKQIKYQCCHVDKHTRPWGSLFIFPWGIYGAATFLIPVCASLVCMNYYTIIYGLAYCIQTQQTILELKETES